MFSKYTYQALYPISNTVRTLLAKDSDIAAAAPENVDSPDEIALEVAVCHTVTAPVAF